MEIQSGQADIAQRKPGIWADSGDKSTVANHANMRIGLSVQLFCAALCFRWALGVGEE